MTICICSSRVSRGGGFLWARYPCTPTSGIREASLCTSKVQSPNTSSRSQTCKGVYVPRGLYVPRDDLKGCTYLEMTACTNSLSTQPETRPQTTSELSGTGHSRMLEHPIHMWGCSKMCQERKPKYTRRGCSNLVSVLMSHTMAPTE